MAYNKALANSTLILRIFTLLILASSVIVMATNEFTLSDDGTKRTFKDIIAYRYVIATAMIGFVYTIFQIPFAIYHVCTEKRLISNGCLSEFDFYGDKIISFLLATGVGTGFGVSFELKTLVNQVFDALQELGVTGLEERRSKTNSFFNRGNIATAILFLGFFCMAILSILSSISRNANTGRGFF